jgi:hypothetical protein
MPEREVYLRTLRRAAELVGDPERLALALKVTPSHLALWLDGNEQPPVEVFLRAVDLVSERDFKPS